MRKAVTVAILMATLLLVFGSIGAGTALAVSPGTTGQPSQSCGSTGANFAPAGFNTTGFAHAGTVYAGSDGTASLNSGNSHAVSQYDVACLQVTSAGVGVPAS